MSVELFDHAVAEQRIQELHATSMHVSIAATGAGLGIQDQLWAVPGASATLIDAHNPYNQAAFNRFLGHDWGTSGHGYTSELGAVALAQRAFFGAQELSASPLLNNYHVAGLGLTAAVSTNRTRRGDNKVHAAVRTNSGIETADVYMSKALGRETDGAICGLVGVNLVLHAAGVDQIPFKRDSGVESEQLVEADGGFILQPKAVKHHEIDPRADSVMVQLDGSVTHVTVDAEQHVIMPGSFNPLQFGHDKIAQAVRETTGKQPVLEITARNIEKSEIGLRELGERATQMRGRWPVILTKGNTRFIDKANAYKDCSFVVGHDTAVRIVDPAYYDSSDAVAKAVQEFKDRNVSFHVVGRRDAAGVFRTAQDIAPEYRDLFVSLPGNFEISSTAIRAALSEKA